MNPTPPPANTPGAAPSPAPAPHPSPAAPYPAGPYPAAAPSYPSPPPYPSPTSAPTAAPPTAAPPQTYPPQTPRRQAPAAPPPNRPFVAARVGGNRPRWLLPAAVAALAIVLIVAVVVIHALGAPALTADWSGRAIVGGDRAQNAGIYLDLKQSGQQLTGVGEGCTLQGSTGTLVKVDLYTVAGTFDGSRITMDWTPIGQGLTRPAVLHVTGQLTSGQLSLTARGPFTTMNVVLQKAPFSDFTGTCQALAK